MVRIATGFNNAENLADLTIGKYLVSPKVPGPIPAREATLLSGHKVLDGYFVVNLELDNFISESVFQDFLSDCFIDSAESAEITIEIPGRTRDIEIWNAIIHRPNPQWIRGRFEAFSTKVILIEDITPE